jgi:aminoglycoside phosphotransferase family enzyme
VNRPLAPGLEGAVLALLPGPEGCRLGPADDPTAREWVVRMRRFDGSLTLAALLARDAVPARAIDELAGRLARFHA